MHGKGWGRRRRRFHVRSEDGGWDEADKRANGKHFQRDGGEGRAQIDEPVGKERRDADASEVEEDVFSVLHDGGVQGL